MIFVAFCSARLHFRPILCTCDKDFFYKSNLENSVIFGVDEGITHDWWRLLNASPKNDNYEMMDELATLIARRATDKKQMDEPHAVEYIHRNHAGFVQSQVSEEDQIWMVWPLEW